MISYDENIGIQAEHRLLWWQSETFPAGCRNDFRFLFHLRSRAVIRTNLLNKINRNVTQDRFVTLNDYQTFMKTPTALVGSLSDILAVMNYGIRDRNWIS